MAIDETLHQIQDKVFVFAIYITWILYISIALGLSINAPEYLDILQSIIKIYISLFLIYRFNLFRKVKFTELDAKIAFSAGIFLLGTTAIDGIIKKYVLNLTKMYEDA